MDLGESDLTGLIDVLHEAALEPDLWPSALGRLGQFVGRSGVVVLSAYDPPSDATLLHSVGYDVANWERVQREHSTTETNKYIRMTQSARVGEVIHPREAMSISEWIDDPIHRKFLRPDALSDGMICPLEQSGGSFAAIAVFRGRHYDAEQARLLEHVAPHVRHALTVHQRMNRITAERETYCSALDRHRMGIILTDSTTRVFHCNDAAVTILEQSGGLSIGKHAQLQAETSTETSLLRSRVALAAKSAERSQRQAALTHAPAPAGGSIRISRRLRLNPLEVVIAPLRTRSSDGFNELQASVIVTVADPDHDINLELSVLRELYGLPDAEAKLLFHLLTQDLTSAARAMGITQNTAKTLLKRTFERTGTNRQAALVAKVLSGPLGSIALHHPRRRT